MYETTTCISDSKCQVVNYGHDELKSILVIEFRYEYLSSLYKTECCENINWQGTEYCLL